MILNCEKHKLALEGIGLICAEADGKTKGFLKEFGYGNK